MDCHLQNGVAFFLEKLVTRVDMGHGGGMQAAQLKTFAYQQF